MKLRVPVAIRKIMERHRDALLERARNHTNAGAGGLSVSLDLVEVAEMNGVGIDAVQTQLASLGGVPLVQDGRKKMIVMLGKEATARPRGGLFRPRQERRRFLGGPLDYVLIGMILLTFLFPNWHKVFTEGKATDALGTLMEESKQP
jgi:hypothetical protein